MVGVAQNDKGILVYRTKGLKQAKSPLVKETAKKTKKTKRKTRRSKNAGY